MIGNHWHILFIIYVFNALRKLIDLANLYNMSKIVTAGTVFGVSNEVINKGLRFRESSRCFILVFKIKFLA